MSENKPTPCIHWFRNDLRLSDNPALAAAIDSGSPVIAIYVYSSEDEGRWSMGAASRWWLHHSLTALAGELAQLGGNLLIRTGNAVDLIDSLARKAGATCVYWNERVEPAARAVADQLKKALANSGVRWSEHNSSLIVEPESLLTGENNPYKVFTPYWKKWQTRPCRTPLARPNQLNSWKGAITDPENATSDLDSLNLLPRIKWDAEFYDHWTPGERGAHDALQTFLTRGLANYPMGRDRPDKCLVSRLSPHLHFGEISPHQIWHHVQRYATAHSEAENASLSYIRELAWREFAHYLLWYFPSPAQEPLRDEFRAFPWQCDGRLLKCWQEGKTGFPIVDAGMRELWHSGWMHNRVRMIVASFLVKDLLIPWQLGAEWFWDTLVDADLANNTLGWQWSAGCGADAAPFFRIFNPILQGQRFDPNGDYVRRWVPELRQLPNKWIHNPWQAPPLELAAAGIVLDQTYPAPIVDHSHARQRALAAFSALKA